MTESITAVFDSATAAAAFAASCRRSSFLKNSAIAFASSTLLWSDLENYSGFYNDILQKAREGRTAGRSVTDIVGSYTVPNQYRDFVVTEQRLRDTVQHVFDGN